MRRRHGGRRRGPRTGRARSCAVPGVREESARQLRQGDLGDEPLPRQAGQGSRGPRHGRHHAGHRIRTRTRSPGGATAQADPPPGVHSGDPRAVAEQPGSSMPYGGPPPGRHRAPDPDADALTRRCDGPGESAPRGALQRPAGGGGAARIVHAGLRPGAGGGRRDQVGAGDRTERGDLAGAARRCTASAPAACEPCAAWNRGLSGRAVRPRPPVVPAPLALRSGGDRIRRAARPAFGRRHAVRPPSRAP